ncbi:MAG: DUF1553 domain-containing protein [Planctomycetes bacterium]|nr:DUF1553 domain-containing protein [Planctomycetota bacterium]MCH9724676.1 DUF1553 domain-containing protein [Planctomycetota bacterium]MCH9774827.1 DUF1553 domain-containing protein [Planctomycetota bacterium]
MHLQRQLITAILMLMVCFSQHTFAAEVEEPISAKTPEQIAALGLRGFYTNLQHNKDGSVRLVRLSKPHVTLDKLEHLEQFLKLDYLAIVCPHLGDEGLVHIQHLTNLDTLMLSESAVTDSGLSYLKKLNKLERLSLDNTKITDKGLAQIAHLQQLKVLSLKNTNVTDLGLQHLTGLKNLEVLFLSGTKVSDAGASSLADLKKLKVVYLSRTQVRGKQLARLADLPHLEYLALNHNVLDQNIIDAVSKMSQLKGIGLYHTQLNRDAVNQLKKKLAKTNIFSELGTEADKKSEALLFSDSNSLIEKPVLAPIQERINGNEKLTPDFQRHVIPLLGRLGCNSRNCHGSFQGRGGFQLSMFGYDFKLDHDNLLKRIDKQKPEKSLVLNKPTSEDEHEGGLRLPPGGWEQKLLREWINGGAKSVDKNSPQFVRLEVTPKQIVFSKKGEKAAIKAIAVWSDGTREDVTCLTRFESKDDSVSDVTPEGVIQAKGTGDTYIISYYDNGIFSTQVILPVKKYQPGEYPKVSAPTEIDQHVVNKLQKLGIQPSGLCTDEEFLRRVSLDLTATLPTPEEIRAFVKEKSIDKRSKKIEELLKRSTYVAWWSMKLCDLTGSNAGYLGGTEMAQPVASQWNAWIKRRVQDNVGWDKIVSGIILGTSRKPGQTFEEFMAQQSEYTSSKDRADFTALDNSLPHYWARSNMSVPSDKALAFGYTFLGMRLDCAQCHKHPFDQWSKQDFVLFTEFFTRIKFGVPPDATVLHEQSRNMLGVPVKLNTAALRRQSYLRIAAEGRPIPWREVYIEPAKSDKQIAKLLGGQEINLSQNSDPRKLLMRWMLNEPNHYFAKAFVNRIWAHYFNVGIINPPDDLNQANPPSNKALLDYLVKGFIESGYDMKWLHRTITNSRTYQLSWRPNQSNRKDTRNFSHAVLRRLPAEVAIDAILQATSNNEKVSQFVSKVDGRKISQHPRSYQARAIDFSLLVFGKPLRTTNCDCERQNEPTLLQSLYVRNDEEMLGNLTRADGWLTQLSKTDLKQVDQKTLVNEAYLRTLSRFPEEIEMKESLQYLKSTDTLKEGLHDLLWVLLNTQEFITNH